MLRTAEASYRIGRPEHQVRRALAKDPARYNAVKGIVHTKVSKYTMVARKYTWFVPEASLDLLKQDLTKE